ncbi:ATP-binding protein [Psychrobacter sp. ASPA161_6]|uniref:ATP-binding protein n=1 Tax=Psychrobacter sp. ASPA161_6 TaxID=3160962 RepID=UPI003F7CE82F
MAIVTLVLGNSGSGKSFSMHNLDPNLCGVINVMGKPLPFRAGKAFRKLNTDNAYEINDRLPTFKAPIVIIDDFQYVMANEFMRGVTDEGGGNSVFQRFNRIGQNAWNILNTAINNTSPDQRIYILSHIEEIEGKTKIKTMGKMLDEKIVLEGMVTIVLQTAIRNGEHFFMTKNDGTTTVKTPHEMFNSELIPNDLNAVDDAICDFYGIEKNQTQQAQTA